MSEDDLTAMSDHGVILGRTAPTVRVCDMDRALDFYCRILGMEKTFENGDPVGFVILVRDKAQIHLTLSAGHEGVLEANGVKIVKGLRDQESARTANS
jgi:catechol 2,3-dioxygenase-like lactoylglutathione lyase family enzyme